MFLTKEIPKPFVDHVTLTAMIGSTAANASYLFEVRQPQAPGVCAHTFGRALLQVLE